MAELTVREAVEKAYGPVPEGWTVHVAIHNEADDASQIQPTVAPSGIIGMCWYRGQWINPYEDYDNGHYDRPFGPDISDRPASSFVGFFGKEFDEVVNQ